MCVYKHVHTCRPEDNVGCYSLGAVHLDFDIVFLTDFELRVSQPYSELAG